MRSGSSTLITSNDEIKNIMKLFKSLKNSDLLIKGIAQTKGDETEE